MGLVDLMSDLSTRSITGANETILAAPITATHVDRKTFNINRRGKRLNNDQINNKTFILFILWG
jgi:hypothetical protein